MELEDDPWLEFEHRLARDLSMTVARLREEMDNGEFVRWSRWYARRDAQRELAMRMAGG